MQKEVWAKLNNIRRVAVFGVVKGHPDVAKRVLDALSEVFRQEDVES